MYGAGLASPISLGSLGCMKSRRLGTSAGSERDGTRCGPADESRRVPQEHAILRATALGGLAARMAARMVCCRRAVLASDIPVSVPASQGNPNQTGPRASRAARACACQPQRRGRGDAAASDLHEKGEAGQGCVCEACERSAVWPHRSRATRRDAGQQGGVGPEGAGAGASQHRVSGDEGKARPRAPAPGGRQAQRSACACRGDLPRPSRRADRSARPTRPTRSRGARAYPPRRVHRAPRPLRLPARPGCTRAAAGVGRRVRGARAYRGARGGI